MDHACRAHTLRAISSVTLAYPEDAAGRSTPMSKHETPHTQSYTGSAVKLVAAYDEPFSANLVH
jgi:hypothetical protein